MNATDFEYAGKMASDFGLMICQIDGSSGTEVLPAGCELNFNQVSARHGSLWFTTNTTYDAVLETTFQVGKYVCPIGLVPFTGDEQRELARWLNRKEPHKLKLFSENDIYDYALFEGSFNISEISLDGKVYGFELHFISNRPYAISDAVRKTIFLEPGESYTFLDESDEVGYIYPEHLEVKCLNPTEDTLKLTNSAEGRTTEIKNVSYGEILTFDNVLTLSSSNPNHKTLQNDFNYVFFRIANTYENRENTLSSSIPVEITFEYYPVVKGVSL